MLQCEADFENLLGHTPRLSTPFALEQNKTAGGTKAEKRDTDQPGLD